MWVYDRARFELLDEFFRLGLLKPDVCRFMGMPLDGDLSLSEAESHGSSSAVPTQSCEDTEKFGERTPRNGREGGAEGADIVSARMSWLGPSTLNFSPPKLFLKNPQSVEHLKGVLMDPQARRSYVLAFHCVVLRGYQAARLPFVEKYPSIAQNVPPGNIAQPFASPTPSDRILSAAERYDRAHFPKILIDTQSPGLPFVGCPFLSQMTRRIGLSPRFVHPVRKLRKYLHDAALLSLDLISSFLPSVSGFPVLYSRQYCSYGSHRSLKRWRGPLNLVRDVHGQAIVNYCPQAFHRILQLGGARSDPLGRIEHKIPDYSQFLQRLLKMCTCWCSRGRSNVFL